MAPPARLLLLLLSTTKRVLAGEMESSALEEVCELRRHAGEQQEAAEREDE
jgi:hypothetical protein